jgi:hypothetical protein
MHNAKVATKFVKKQGKKIPPKVAELAQRMVNHAMESAAEEKAESPAVVKAEGAKGEVAEKLASGKGNPSTAARMAHLRSMRGKK